MEVCELLLILSVIWIGFMVFVAYVMDNVSEANLRGTITAKKYARQM